MKVKSIDTYTGKDGQKRWRVHFEGDDKPLILGNQPSFKVGDEIPQEKLKLTSKGDKQYYIWARETVKRSYGKSQEELSQSARTMALSYAKDLAVAMINNVPSGSVKKIMVEEILETADRFVKWIKES